MVGRGPSVLTAFAGNLVHVLLPGAFGLVSFLAFVDNLPELGWAIITVVPSNGLSSFALSLGRMALPKFTFRAYVQY